MHACRSTLEDPTDDESGTPELRSYALLKIGGFRDERVAPWLHVLATNAGANDHERCRAAVELIRLRDGAVAQVEIVNAVVNGNYNTEKSIHAVCANGEIKRNALRAAAARGASQEVRAAAQAQIDEYERRLRN